MGLYQIKKFLHIKGNNYQGDETTNNMGEKSLQTIHLTKG
jgi:hypothetical protein